MKLGGQGGDGREGQVRLQTAERDIPVILMDSLNFQKTADGKHHNPYGLEKYLHHKIKI